jgi:predicted aspartyl protease
LRFNLPPRAAKLLSRGLNDAILRRVKFRGRSSVQQIALSILAAFVVALNLPAAVPRAGAIADQFEMLPLTRSWQNHLLVHARVNGKPAVLMVDSGAPATLISSRRRAEFQIQRIGPNSGLPTSVIVNGVADRLAILHSLRLGALNIVDLPVVLTNVSSPPRIAKMVREQQIDGILGVDVLFATKAVLDCQDQVLILNRYPEVGGAERALDLRGFQKMPIYVSEGYNLFVNSSINGTRTRLLLDTGAVVTTLHLPFVRQLRIPYYATSIKSSGINRKEDAVDVARIRRLSVGSVNVFEKAIGVADLKWLLPENNPPRGAHAIGGLLGAEILKAHHGIIDFGTRTLYLKN